MTAVLRPFLIALQFLTALPVRAAGAPDAAATGRSLLYYPLVGLVLGLLLTALAWLLDGAPAPLAAAVVLACWVALTGALHLDGLADSADAWLGGLGDRERTLAIMKDPCCGPAGVVALILVLLLKFAALMPLAAPGADRAALMLAPLLGRTAALALFLTTPYVRPGGLGAALAARPSRRGGALIVVLAATATLWAGGLPGLWMLAGAAGVFVIARIALLRRLGGTTGDTTGALIEIVETAAIVTLALA